MPEFLTQIEQACGLPWWCVLLLAVLVLIILVLAICLGRARSRAKVAAVKIPTAPATGEDPLGDMEPQFKKVMKMEASDDMPQQEEEALADEPAEPEAADDEAAEPEPGEAAEPAEAEEPADEEPAPEEAEPEEAAEPESEDDEASEPAAEEQVPSELLEDEPKTIDPNVPDDDILKATGGNHMRVGQSPFGIDFGFLEEYEEEYERALQEFRRLRHQNDAQE